MKRILPILIASALAAFVLSACTGQNNTEAQSEEEITIEISSPSGSVRGLQVNGVNVFKGIPYATAPLRFAPPEAVEPWTETLDCTEFGAIYPQTALADFPETTAEISEDCLTANIWTTAAAPDAKMPVYVWIHGGAFAVGAGTDPLYDGTNYAKQGIVFVTINYRLNAGGFMASEETMKQYGTTGNWGILDQIQALKWVKNNIAAFGGDPDCVTIGGESAGSYSVSGLIQSPMAAGLFQNAIMESGSMLGIPGNSQYAKGNLERSIDLSKQLMFSFGVGDDASGLAKMRAVPYNLLHDMTAVNVDFTADTTFMMMPVFDGNVMAENPYKALKKGEFNKVNLLWGYNTNEGSVFVPVSTNKNAFESLAVKMFGVDNLQSIIERFPADENNPYYQRGREILAHGMFTTVMKPYGDVLSDAGMNVFAYQFDYAAEELKAAGMGVMHSSEMAYVFGNLPPDAADMQKKVSDEMFSRWVNFIKTGNPNGSNARSGITWEAYDSKNNKMMIFNENSSMQEMLNKSEIIFMENLMFGDGSSNGCYFSD